MLPIREVLEAIGILEFVIKYTQACFQKEWSITKTLCLGLSAMKVWSRLIPFPWFPKLCFNSLVWYIGASLSFKEGSTRSQVEIYLRHYFAHMLIYIKDLLNTSGNVDIFRDMCVCVCVYDLIGYGGLHFWIYLWFSHILGSVHRHILERRKRSHLALQHFPCWY